MQLRSPSAGLMNFARLRLAARFAATQRSGPARACARSRSSAPRPGGRSAHRCPWSRSCSPRGRTPGAGSRAAGRPGCAARRPPRIARNCSTWLRSRTSSSVTSSRSAAITISWCRRASSIRPTSCPSCCARLRSRSRTASCTSPERCSRNSASRDHALEARRAGRARARRPPPRASRRAPRAPSRPSASSPSRSSAAGSSGSTKRATPGSESTLATLELAAHALRLAQRRAPRAGTAGPRRGRSRAGSPWPRRPATPR